MKICFVFQRAKIYNDKEEEAEEKSPQIIEGSEEPIKKKRKRLVSEDVASSGTTVIKPKKVKTVKALLEEKRVQEIQPTGKIHFKLKFHKMLYGYQLYLFCSFNVKTLT